MKIVELCDDSLFVKEDLENVNVFSEIMSELMKRLKFLIYNRLTTQARDKSQSISFFKWIFHLHRPIDYTNGARVGSEKIGAVIKVSRLVSKNEWKNIWSFPGFTVVSFTVLPVFKHHFTPQHLLNWKSKRTRKIKKILWVWGTQWFYFASFYFQITQEHSFLRPMFLEWHRTWSFSKEKMSESLQNSVCKYNCQ